MSALRRYNRATLKPELIDEGPNVAWKGHGYYGALVQGDSEADRHREQERRHKQQKKDNRKLNDPAFIGSPAGQAWLEQRNRALDKARRG